jgi:predicted signal transduction protein with EAL and GGDEF domain
MFMLSDRPETPAIPSPVVLEFVTGQADLNMTIRLTGAPESYHAAGLLLEGRSWRSTDRVLDACAAPGGKTAHLLELADLDLIALDVDAQRCRRIHENLQRLRLQAEVRCADAAETGQWWDGRAFDAILLDAPAPTAGALATQVIHDIRAAMNQPINIVPGADIRMGLSIGAATYPEDGVTARQLMRVADARMYRDKRGEVEG